jgi:hypothetical protein
VRLLFILGPYRPGQCGVSDYVRLLSERLEGLGHECMRMSVDPRVGATLATTADSLPPCDAVSLQFAPYAFHPKGLPGQGLQSLAKALAGRHLQVMFHEIWIGAYPQSTWRERWIGGRQRHQILSFLETAQPFAVHATNAAALNRLDLMGVEAEYLYLFGNIPWAEAPSARMDADPVAHIAFFGTPYDSFPYDLLFERLVETFTAMKRPWNIRMLGHVREKTGLRKLHREAGKHGITVEETSRLTSEELSHELQFADCGVATTPYDVLGKSGAAAAMLEHGLPIYAYDDGDTPKDSLFVFEPFQDQIFLLNDPKSSEQLIKSTQQLPKPFFNGVAHTADKFIEAII